MGKPAAIIFGAGPGLGAALATASVKAGLATAVVARDGVRLKTVAERSGATAMACDVTQADQVDDVVARVERDVGALDFVVFNAAARLRGPLLDLNRDDVRRALVTGAHAGFIIAQAVLRRMVARRHGTLIFTGATASIKGMAQSAPFAMQKFALRGLAQSLAREFQPQGLHIAHVVLDGVIASSEAAATSAGTPPADREPQKLDPDAIAATYLALYRQDPSAWTFELELRPMLESF